jgi:muramoyltetrapeptide carboxypeptidase
MALRLPPPLRPGSLVAVVAPSGPFDREELFRGLAWLRTRYRLRVSSRILSRDGYLAGDDARRVGELAAALSADEVEAVMCARGGYGAMRILDAVPWAALVARPRWIVGFSDVTALHLSATAVGVASIHAPNVTGLGRKLSAAERASLLCALERPEAEGAWSGLSVLSGGRARGPLVGGNLALVSAMAAAGRLAIPEGAILVLEDVTERPYRVDRMLTSLRLGGYLRRVSGIVLGGFTQCEPGPDGVAIDDLLATFAREAGVPVLSGAPFGHGAPNHAFVMGRDAEIDGDALVFGRA